MAKKKVETLPLSLDQKYEMIELNTSLAVMHQCRLIHLSKGTYYRHVKLSQESEIRKKKQLIRTQQFEELKDEIIQMFALDPSLGTRRMTTQLKRVGYKINRKRVKRIMRENNLISRAPGPHTSTPRKEHKIYPYLLREAKIEDVDQVWSTDITYVKVGNSFMYVSAIIDWYSRFIVAWDVSNTLDVESPLKALDKALSTGRKPLIFNTDQGCQFTSERFTQKLKDNNIRISMDSKGRAIDNIYIERFWRSLKYEWLNFWDYQNGHQLHHAVKDYIERYNYLRTHQSLGDATPAEVYMGDISAPVTFIKRKYQGELISIKMICENLETDQSTEVLEEEKHH